ncbi:MAG: type I-E CRISPR-associated protein Cas7/Cse4/CasC [Desulfurivibrionaceae bacterium]
MSTFIQLHLLTSYPPSNLNRDDLGRPKTAIMGGKTRLRVSSQSLKRAWRTSDLFESAMSGHIGTRTKQLGLDLYQRMIKEAIEPKDAKEWAKTVAGTFGKLKGEDKKNPEKLVDLEIEQLAHISPEEREAVDALVGKLIFEKRAPKPDELALLRHPETAVDIALFGRMLTKNSREESIVRFGQEAACQVAHAITVHDVAVEDDYFTAVDDLNSGEEDLGAAHIGETEFAAGLFYLYLCINRDLLIENLGGDRELANKALASLVEAAAKVAPNGKQNSFASRAYASYILVEKGKQQPRSLSVAYLKPVRGEDVLGKAITEIETKRANMEKTYGKCADTTKTMNAETGEGSLNDIISFVKE